MASTSPSQSPGVPLVVTVAKSLSDARFYRGLQLTNGARVLLVSDPEFQFATAAISLGVGALRDPPDLPGLAHFCSILTLATQQQAAIREADEDQLGVRAMDSSDWCDLPCSAEQASYEVECMSANLPDQLARLRVGLSTPALTEPAILDQLHRMQARLDGEDSQNSVQGSQTVVERALSNPAHPFSRCLPDSLLRLVTSLSASPHLLPDLARRLLDFHQRLYSANQLCLCVTGPDSLDRLQEMVQSSFGSMVNKSVPQVRCDAHPYEGTATGIKVYIEPQYNRSMELVFPLPDQRGAYKSSPDLYVTHLLRHEGPGGLLACLAKRGLAQDLSACLDTESAPGFDSLKIRIDLTAKGTMEENKVITALFRYLAMLRHVGPQEWFHTEMRNLRRQVFTYPMTSVEVEFGESLATRMHRYPLEDVLTARHELTVYSPSGIAELLALLKPDKCKVFISHPLVLEKCNRSESRCGIKYGVEVLGPELLAACAAVWPSPNSEFDAELRMPEPNRFVCASLEIKPPKPLDQSIAGVPRQLFVRSSSVSKSGIRLWYGEDNRHELPQAFYSVELLIPALLADCATAVAADLYVSLLEDWSLASLAYEARQAGMRISFERSEHGIQILCRGLSQRLPDLLEAALQRMTRPDFDKESFERVRDFMTTELRDALTTESLAQRYRYYRELICSDLAWPAEKKIAALEGLTLTKLTEFARQYLLPPSNSAPRNSANSQQPTRRLYAEILVYGNATVDEASRVAQSVTDALRPEVPAATEAPRPSGRRLLTGGSHSTFRWAHPGPANESSCCVCYQTVVPEPGQARLRHQVLFCLVARVVRDAFDELHATEQLQGMTGTLLEQDMYEWDALTLVLLADAHPVEVENRIDALVAGFGSHLTQLSADRLREHIEGMLTELLAENKLGCMTDWHDWYWANITRGDYWFAYREQLAGFLRQPNCVGPGDLLEFWRTWLDKSSPSRRKLSLHSVSQATFKDYSSYKGTIIQDPMAFKATLEHVPLQQTADLSVGFHQPSRK